MTVLAASRSSAYSADVALGFTSLQRSDKGPGGDVCDQWTLDYTMIRLADDVWYIDNAQPFHGAGHTSC